MTTLYLNYEDITGLVDAVLDLTSDRPRNRRRHESFMGNTIRRDLGIACSVHNYEGGVKYKYSFIFVNEEDQLLFQLRYL